MGNFLNELILEEIVTAITAQVGDPEMIKDKVEEVKGHIAKIPEDMVIVVTKLSGTLHVAITKQEHTDFSKDPEFMDVEAMIQKVLDSL